MVTKKKKTGGRPSFLKKPVKRNVVLEEKHWKALDRYAKQHNITGRSAAIRHMIEER